jgi:hypothetical protein
MAHIRLAQIWLWRVARRLTTRNGLKDAVKPIKLVRHHFVSYGLCPVCLEYFYRAALDRNSSPTPAQGSDL